MRSVVKSLWGRLAAYFIAGVLAVLPLVITVALVGWLIGFIRGLIGPETLLGKGFGYVTVLGWIITLAVVFGLGVAIVEFGAKRLLKGLVDPIIARIPLIGSVYGTSTQFIDMLDRRSEDQLKGMSPVFCTFGEGGAGVLALLVTPERFPINGREYQVVIVPTAPVPFGGWLVFVPVESVRPAGMTVDGLMSVYVSMGVTTAQHLPAQTNLE
jgi:uncharacterized membrane protein